METALATYGFKTLDAQQIIVVGFPLKRLDVQFVTCTVWFAHVREDACIGFAWLPNLELGGGFGWRVTVREDAEGWRVWRLGMPSLHLLDAGAQATLSEELTLADAVRIFLADESTANHEAMRRLLHDAS